MRKSNKFSTPAGFRRFFLWNLWGAFGIIFSVTASSAAPEDLYSSRSRRDPFVPLVTKETRQAASGLVGVESLDEISIEGIVYDPKNGSMIIANGTLLKEGEEQGAVKVLKIEAGGARFSVNGIEGFKAQYQSEQPKKES